MENKTKVAEKDRKSKAKIVIIALLAIIVIGISITAFFLISDKSFSDVKGFFESKDEYTILLDEFVTNLQTEERSNNYLKIQVALMYKDKKNTSIIESNTSKIRDIVLNDLREKTPEQILEVDKTPELKTILLEKLNDSLGNDIIEEVYFTNLIVQ